MTPIARVQVAGADYFQHLDLSLAEAHGGPASAVATGHS